MRNAYKPTRLFVEPEEKGSLGRHRHRWENNTRINTKE
jgi:hypothetical protein